MITILIFALVSQSCAALRCYTCDSRRTGLEGCDILNTTSPYVSNSASFHPSESCAMIIGLAGKDLTDFTIRTFIDNCVNQSLENITYNGITFQGRMNCCSTSLCNKHPLYTNLTRSSIVEEPRSHMTKIIILVLIGCLGFTFVVIGITLSIYRFHLNKSHQRYIPAVISDGITVLFLSPTLN